MHGSITVQRAVFRRPSREDSLCRRRWDLQESGGPHLRREHLLSEALREKSRPRGISSPEEEPRICSEVGREGNKAPGGGPEAEAFRHPPRALRLHTRPHGALGESLNNLPRHSPDWVKQEKGGRSATERDEFQRAAWRVMVAAAVEPERLLFVDECGTHTSLGPIYGYAPRGERLLLSVPRKRGKNTTLLSSMPDTVLQLTYSGTCCDYNIPEGEFLPLGLVALTASPHAAG